MTNKHTDSQTDTHTRTDKYVTESEHDHRMKAPKRRMWLSLIGLAVLLLFFAVQLYQSIASTPLIRRADRNAKLTVTFAAREKCARDVTEEYALDPILRGLALVAQGEMGAAELQTHAQQILDDLNESSLTERIDRECPHVPTLP